MTQEHWSSDTPISMPEPPPTDVPVQIDFEGFGFSMNGIVHNLSGADLEDMTTPYFSPEGYIGSQSEEDDGPLGIQGDNVDADDDEDDEYTGLDVDDFDYDYEVDDQ